MATSLTFSTQTEAGEFRDAIYITGEIDIPSLLTEIDRRAQNFAYAVANPQPVPPIDERTSEEIETARIEALAREAGLL